MSTSKETEKELRRAQEATSKFWEYWSENDENGFLDKLLDAQNDVVWILFQRLCVTLGIDANGAMGESIHEMLVEQILGSEHDGLFSVIKELRLDYPIQQGVRRLKYNDKKAKEAENK